MKPSLRTTDPGTRLVRRAMPGGRLGRLIRRAVRATSLVLGASMALSACGGPDPVGAVVDELLEGTWGGVDSGVIVNESTTHVHIGCTYGDFPPLIELNEDLRFNVAGEYQLRGYPIVLGPPVPARFAGVVEGADLTFTIAVNDTIAGQLVVLGPITVRYGVDPQMAICPICAMPTGSSVPATTLDATGPTPP